MLQTIPGTVQKRPGIPSGHQHTFGPTHRPPFSQGRVHPAPIQGSVVRAMVPCRAGQGRAGQGRAGQGRAGQGITYPETGAAGCRLPRALRNRRPAVMRSQNHAISTNQHATYWAAANKQGSLSSRRP
jgi:hypothetical protein